MSGEGLRIGFLGNDPWSVPALRAIASSAHEVVAVVTNVPRPAGRGSVLTPTAVSAEASATGLPLLEIERVGDAPGRTGLAAAEPDVLVVVAYGELLTGDVLRMTRFGALNVHFSMLPALRGASPVQHALLEGRGETGVTTMQIDEGLDTGPVLLQVREQIRDEDNAGSLGARLAELGANLIARTLDDLVRGELAPVAQDETRASWAPRLGAADRNIDWSQPGAQIVRRVRALAPEPAAAARFRGEHLKVFQARFEADGAGVPGTLVADPDRLLVSAADGAVELVEVALSGRRRMRSEEFVRGYRPEPGERLG